MPYFSSDALSRANWTSGESELKASSRYSSISCFDIFLPYSASSPMNLSSLDIPVILPQVGYSVTRVSFTSSRKIPLPPMGT